MTLRLVSRLFPAGTLALMCAFLPLQAEAAVAFGTIGTAAVGSTSLVIPYPASIAAGDLLVMTMVNTYPTNAPVLPIGWQAVTNGQGYGGVGANSGNDSGFEYTTVFVRVADGTETGSVTVNIPSGNCAIGAIARYTKGSGKYWDLAASNGSDGLGNTAWSITAAANPGITTGDLMVAVSGENSDGANNRSYSAEAMAATGATFGTAAELLDTRTTTGGQCALAVSDHPVSSGTASVAPQFTMTLAGSITGNGGTGSTVFLRLRETTNPSSSITVSVPTTVTGSVSVVGAVAKGSGTFVIDHPLDPKNKLLYHSFVESPDAMNIYDGIVQLDNSGKATVQLPDYFLALNKDFQYLLTAIGQAMPGLYISREVHRRWWLFGPIEFSISGGVPNGNVSWQVTGVRHDPFIVDNPIIPVVEKGPNALIDIGKYLCPECYVQK
jgi:hypothetical protein